MLEPARNRAAPSLEPAQQRRPRAGLRVDAHRGQPRPVRARTLVVLTVLAVVEPEPVVPGAIVADPCGLSPAVLHPSQRRPHAVTRPELLASRAAARHREVASMLPGAAAVRARRSAWWIMRRAIAVSKS